ncbi:hypothetical protein ACPC54_41065 [Kitasatospora sp. NPDC094028]
MRHPGSGDALDFEIREDLPQRPVKSSRERAAHSPLVQQGRSNGDACPIVGIRPGTGLK